MNVIKFVQYLRKNRSRKVKAKELMGILNVEYKSIYNYKKAAVENGYNIKSFAGYKGGYKIDEPFLTNADAILVRNNLPKELADKIIQINRRL